LGHRLAVCDVRRLEMTTGAKDTIYFSEDGFLVGAKVDRAIEETLVLGQPRGPQTGMTPADVAAAVEPAGFILACVVELPPYHYGAIFQKPTE
jgi:hypothetical protein